MSLDRGGILFSKTCQAELVNFRGTPRYLARRLGEEVAVLAMNTSQTISTKFLQCFAMEWTPVGLHSLLSILLHGYYRLAFPLSARVSPSTAIWSK